LNKKRIKKFKKMDYKSKEEQPEPGKE